MSIREKHYLFLRNLDYELKESIKTYTTSEYKIINKELRSGSSLTERTQRTVNNIDKVFEMIEPITEPLVLYRGIKRKERINPGTAFVSTTYDEDVAKGFAGVKCCLVVITIPIGSKVLFIESISDSPDELEVLIDRSGSFAITNVVEARSVGDKDLINVVYIPPKAVKVEEKDLEPAIEAAMDQLAIIQRLIDTFPKDEYDTFGDDEETLIGLIDDLYKQIIKNKETIPESMAKTVVKRLFEKYGPPSG